MQFIVVTCLFVLTVSAAVCADSREAFRHHNRRLKEFPCKKPQPRVFELEELKGNTELMELIDRGLKDKIKPAVTVLHRCQSTGCCEDSNNRCMPIAADEVTLTFAFFDRTLQYVKVKEKNHTKCACMAPSDSDIK